MPETGGEGSDRLALTEGWELARTVPGACPGADGLGQLRWSPARVPGTAAGAAVSQRGGDQLDFDADDWWFRAEFDAHPPAPGEEAVLALGGLATVAEVYLNGRRVLDSDSMFAAHELDVGHLLRGHNELAICCRALGPLLQIRRKPRARWRTRLVSEPNLRFFRTMLIGRCPGFAPGPAVVGPWRPVVLERRRGMWIDSLRLRTRVDGETGRLTVQAELRALAGTASVDSAAIELKGPGGSRSQELELETAGAGVHAAGVLTIANPELWWPHTHGAPALYDTTLHVRTGDREVSTDAGRIGFRVLSAAPELERDGLRLAVNGVPIFARGAVWTPLDLTAPHASEGDLRRVLGRVVDAGMNMLRVPGIGCYESSRFYDLCDELGILVWQDFMFANLDYPEEDPGFMAAVEREARAVLAQLGRRPSLAVLCGGSEVAQQIAMLGLDPALAAGPLYAELLPRLVEAAGVDAPYIPSTPWGGDLPFRPEHGVAHYFGVGAYLRPLQDARRAEVKFAAECLAFANVPDAEALPEGGSSRTVGGRDRLGVPRDTGADWDFQDVRDHYLQLLYGVDPDRLRGVDPERYLELSRHVSGELMAEVMGEFRRAQSSCAGALVLWLKDLAPGSGWGVLDHRGVPKPAYHQLRRALAPVAVWGSDEGLSGIVAHVANDLPRALEARLRVSLYRDFELRVDEATVDARLSAHSAMAVNVESMLGRFVDVTWAYRFGAPAQDVVVLTLEAASPADDGRVLSQACRLPVWRPTERQTADQLGLSATLGLTRSGALVTIASGRLLVGARVRLPGFTPEDDHFFVEPGRPRSLRLRRDAGGGAEPTGALSAVNLAGQVALRQR